MKKTFLLILLFSSQIVLSAERGFFSMLDDALAEKIETATYHASLVSAGEFTHNNKPAFGIFFGKNENDFFSFTAQCDVFNRNINETISGDVNSNPISLDYNDNYRKLFLMSETKFDTYVDLNILIDDANKIFTFILEGKISDGNISYKVNPQYVLLSAEQMREIRDGCMKR